MNDYLSMLFETLFGFAALFLLTKVLGKTQISQLTPFDFISALILGELVGNALFDKEAGIPEIAFVIILWGVLLYLTEIITQKWKRTRAFMEGSPDIIIYRGKLIRDTMKKCKLDLNHLQHLLREKDVFSIQDVEYAILETNGKVSVLKKAANQTPTKNDLKVATHDVHLATTLINDGEIIYDNLKEKNLTEEWLIEELHKQDYSSPKEVFYAEYIKDKQLFLLPFTNRGHKRFK
ncbi:YetF domain-containing protein [Oceanobacillus picturae]|uniref:YetF domain-containing protein n=1 Tax=Oceanobacillus picturae TaxID=171693 RepID=UPI0036441FB3